MSEQETGAAAPGRAACGADHYREAEQLIAAANRRLTANDAEWLHVPHRRAELRAEAQVHATLALVDAVRQQTAMLTAPVETPERDW